MKFPNSKILYLAAGVTPLHVAPSERQRGTDLWRGVAALLRTGRLEKVGEDDAGEYFRVTPKGERQLIKGQIEWRESRGRPTDDLKARLKELTT